MATGPYLLPDESSPNADTQFLYHLSSSPQKRRGLNPARRSEKQTCQLLCKTSVVVHILMTFTRHFFKKSLRDDSHLGDTWM
jgi:hypothetical protein